MSSRGHFNINGKFELLVYCTDQPIRPYHLILGYHIILVRYRYDTGVHYSTVLTQDTATMSSLAVCPILVWD